MAIRPEPVLAEIMAGLEIGSSVPPEFWTAVAAVLAFLWRTDARLRTLVAAFERDVAARTAALDAQAAGLAQPEPLDLSALVELERAVARLARVMVTGPP